MMWRCDLVPQYEAYQHEIDAAIQDVLQSGRYVLAENTQAFEEEFAAYIRGADIGDARDNSTAQNLVGVGLNSGTDALVYPLWCQGIGPGDEVITTPFTAIPTYAAIRSVGATPVFVDIDPRTYLMDVEQIPEVVTPKTRAVIAVHLFGNVVDVERIRELVPSGTFILEDCAQSHGALLRDQRAGSLGDAAAFSFYPTKNLGAYGDAGMVVTADSELAGEIRLRRMYGMVNKDEFILDGGNSRLDEIQAAILRVKLRYLDAMNDARKDRAEHYCVSLPEALQPQQIDASVDAVYHVFAARVDGDRDGLVEHLSKADVQSNIYYPRGLHEQIPYQELATSQPELPQTEALARQVIALPFYPELPYDSIDEVVAATNDYLDRNTARNAPSPRSVSSKLESC